jgi:hypothetical protein
LCGLPRDRAKLLDALAPIGAKSSWKGRVLYEHSILGSGVVIKR